jgi:hypothetical protein
MAGSRFRFRYNQTSTGANPRRRQRSCSNKLIVDKKYQQEIEEEWNPMGRDDGAGGFVTSNTIIWRKISDKSCSKSS